MPWLLITFPAAAAEVEPISDTLEASGALSVTVTARSSEARLQSALEPTALWHENQVAGLFPADADVDAVLARVRAALPAAAARPCEIATLADADWSRAWMTQYQPIRISPRLWICPSWCEPPDPRAINLLLDPGLAFGTGTHPTTALCLAWLCEQELTGRSVLDFGCGSGILAIAALKLGAARALAVDIDPQALVVARENAARNGVEANLAIARPEALGEATADIVLANILAEPLIALAPELTRRVAPRGLLALSGLLREQIGEVAPHYAAHFALAPREREGWALLAGARLY